MTSSDDSVRHFWRAGGIAPALIALTVLAACEDGAVQNPFKKADTASGATADTQPQSTTTVERKVEAPEIFSVTEAGLFDGRPSLGGVWVAHPDAKDPIQVIIRNSTNNKFVFGALYRREREIPGPRLQISSDAAAALGVLAGQPVELNVTALRREEVVEEPVETTETTEVTADDAAAAATVSGGETPPVKVEAIGTVAAAEAAIANAEAKKATTVSVKPATAATAPKASSLEKPYIQIGIFSVEANAQNAAAQMRNAGMIPIVKEGKLKGKKFWRVIVGPAQSRFERNTLKKNIHSTGFTDAYAVTH